MNKLFNRAMDYLGFMAYKSELIEQLVSELLLNLNIDNQKKINFSFKNSYTSSYRKNKESNIAEFILHIKKNKIKLLGKLLSTNEDILADGILIQNKK